jgi:hypothetical protein
MKQSIESAKKRRGVPTPQPTTTSNTSTQNISPAPQVLTIPQILDNIGKRLITLELFMNETKKNGLPSVQRNINVEQETAQNISLENATQMDEIVDEFDKRHQMLATEIASLKDIVLNLQKYTMDVNKMLLEERSHIINELENRIQDEQPENNEQPYQNE